MYNICIDENMYDALFFWPALDTDNIIHALDFHNSVFIRQNVCLYSSLDDKEDMCV